ncbi:MAG: type I restriction-modification system subunit M N-terminal domain-containing protein [Jatrophihabitantaceae bacterium]
MATPAGFENKVAFIWKIADKLRGNLKPHEYGSVMLPTLVLFRLDAVLEPTKPAVLACAQGLDLTSATADPLLRRAAGGLPFYNTSPLSMKTMLSDDKNIAAQLQAYVAGFSPAAAEVLDAFGYQQTIVKLDKAGVLYAVLGDFADVDLHPDVVSNEAMGYIFEELLRKFSEMSNETAGEHYTPREVITLMVDLLLDEDGAALGASDYGDYRRGIRIDSAAFRRQCVAPSTGALARCSRTGSDRRRRRRGTGGRCRWLEAPDRIDHQDQRAQAVVDHCRRSGGVRRVVGEWVARTRVAARSGSNEQAMELQFDR